MLNITSQPPLALYIHTPWCVKKCPYCDFNSHEASATVPERDYLTALMADLESDLHRVWGRRVQSIFIGGGTPSLLSPQFYDTLMSELRARLMVSANAEITMEANPGTVEAQRFAAYRSAGINRLSIGVQSFNDKFLKRLGRIHDGTEARVAIEVAQQAGFDNINIDLMFGLPQQSLQQAQQDLEVALQYNPQHLSYYQLTIEPNTLFHSERPELPDDDVSWSIQASAQQAIAENGYEQYEVSAYALDTFQCVHNRNYWEFGDYLGIGAGAHSKLTDVNARSIVRLIKEKHPREYLQKAVNNTAIIKEQLLNRDELPVEFMLNALRLKQGFDPRWFAERTGLPISIIDSLLKDAEQRGLIEWTMDLIRPTDLGFRFLNDLQVLFLPD